MFVCSNNTRPVILNCYLDCRVSNPLPLVIKNAASAYVHGCVTSSIIIASSRSLGTFAWGCSSISMLFHNYLSHRLWTLVLTADCEKILRPLRVIITSQSSDSLILFRSLQLELTLEHFNCHQTVLCLYTEIFFFTRAVLEFVRLPLSCLCKMSPGLEGWLNFWEKYSQN